MSSSSFYSHGKLLLTGEYLVLNGALSLAMPTKLGQKMIVTIDSVHKNQILHWVSYNQENKLWFKTKINYKTWEIINKKNDEFSLTLKNVLKEAAKLTNYFSLCENDILIETHLEFPNNWGLGSSSTFINNLCTWLSIDAYTLLFKTLGGSGYDIACAKNNTTILYNLLDKTPITTLVNFYPDFQEQLYFVHLNKKQKSSLAISNYKSKGEISKENIDAISAITKEILVCKTIDDFSILIDKHEEILSAILNEPTAKKKLFNDYPHTIKSLGAWGGDFILVVTKSIEDLSYFKQKGYATIIKYQEMVLG